MLCFVGFELKLEEFKPEHLEKLNFYLDALDRDVKKPHENPIIGILICKTKDSEVVEYAMSRYMSQALIAEYQTKLPDKKSYCSKRCTSCLKTTYHSKGDICGKNQHSNI